MSQETDDAVEGFIAKKVVGWVIFVTVGLVFAGGMWAQDVRSRLMSLEESRITKVEAADLRNAIEMLRLEVNYLRLQRAMP